MTQRERKYYYIVIERKDWFFNIETRETGYVAHKWFRLIKKREKKLIKALNHILNDKDLRPIVIDVETLPTLKLIN